MRRFGCGACCWRQCSPVGRRQVAGGGGIQNSEFKEVRRRIPALRRWLHSFLPPAAFFSSPVVIAERDGELGLDPFHAV
jgi:hypothetical protein